MSKKNPAPEVAKTADVEVAEFREFAGLSGIAEEELADVEAGQQADEKAQAAEAAASEEDNVEGWTKAVDMAGDVICSMFPDASPVWNKERKNNLGAALARCDEHYGWGGVGGLLGNPLIGLAFAGFPLVAGTARAIKVAKDRDTIEVKATDVTGPTDPMAATASGEVSAAA